MPGTLVAVGVVKFPNSPPAGGYDVVLAAGAAPGALGAAGEATPKRPPVGGAGEVVVVVAVGVLPPNKVPPAPVPVEEVVVMEGTVPKKRPPA